MPSGTKNVTGPLTQEIAAILRERMSRMKYTDRDLSEAVGADCLSRSQVNKIRAGQKHVDIDDYERICVALGLDFIEVLTRAAASTPDRHSAAGWDVRRL